MRFLLINPPLSGAERYGRYAQAGSYLPPLGLAYLAAMLEGRHEVRILDAAAEELTLDETLARVREFDPAVVGITVIAATFGRAVTLCDRVKQASPGVVTVLGGPHPTACPDACLAPPSVDVVAIGEGEQTVAELADALAGQQDLGGVRGIGFKRDGAAVFSARRARADLDALPLPARHLLPMERYMPSAMHYRRLPAHSVVCGRGCPYRCTFCSCAKVFAGKVTVRSPENVAAEAKVLKERWGARELLFWDDTFGLSDEWTRRLCELLRPLDVSWSAWMRVDLVSPEILREMARSGCWHVSYGVESGNQRVLDGIRKGFKIQDVRNAFRWTHEAGMEARGTFVLGLPGDDIASMRDTVELAVEIQADYATFQLLTPYPGTELWDEAERLGTFLSRDLDRYTIWNPVWVPTGLTAAELTKAHRGAYRRFYLRPSYILRRLRAVRSVEDLRRNVRGAMSIVGLGGS
jgi:radical SAM superfamily enzyme YgiQ (UPF0313 family)